MHKADEYIKEVETTIIRIMSMGNNTIESILPHISGADVRLVNEIVNRLSKDKHINTETNPENIIDVAARARRMSASLPLVLPSQDPLKSQWWFTLDAIEKVAEEVWKLCGGKAVAFIGAPTVGYYYNNRYESQTTILDIDPDIIKCFENIKNLNAIVYDVNDYLQEGINRNHSVVVIDPPWYPEETEIFISRANEILERDGFIFCIIPPRLTRPGIIEQRTELLKKLLDFNFEIIAIESDFVSYRVPDFETEAFKDMNWFSSKPWRKGDLLVIKVNDNSSVKLSGTYEKKNIDIYSRDKNILRVFQYSDVFDDNITDYLCPIDNFMNNVSNRTFNKNDISVWTSQHKAVKVKNPKIMHDILEAWESNYTLNETIDKLKVLHPSENIEKFVRMTDDTLLLWQNLNSPKKRRTPEQIIQAQETYLSEFAIKPTNRKYEYKNDGFRLDFQRDRDRVLWSHSLKRLANKCQVFPVMSDDSLRRRLSHSIEVMQLSSTIATSFGLNRDLTEAGALVHDIGHTPFGHAGEHALNKTLNDIEPRFGGFNHYEHGVDVVRWLEDVYSSPAAGGFPGLNLTYETVESIIKHTFFRDNGACSQSTIIKNSKHKDIKDDSCHLEGQAIRIADKVSYLISDLEDGIRMGVLNLEHFNMCRFFYRAPIDMVPSQGESFYEHFISQRRSILKVIMEDILNETDRRLSKVNDINDIRANKYYIVDFSEDIKNEMNEIWRKLQSGILHKDSHVVASNIRAANIVSRLFYLYSLAPELIDEKFRKSHEKLKVTDYGKYYYDKLGKEIGLAKRVVSAYSYERVIGATITKQGDNFQIPTWNLVQAKDYVASLTDTRALKEYRKHLEVIES